MDIKYEKTGIVSVQDVNLKDPKGQPVSLEIDFLMETFTLSVKAWDDLNNIGRTYTVDMDDTFKSDITQFFLLNIGRVMREGYPEFKDLTLIQ